MSNTEQNVTQGPEYITAREFTAAVQFLSDKIDTGFLTTHQKQDYTNGRLLRAEAAIAILQGEKIADRAVENIAEKARNRMDTWKVTVLTTVGTSAMGAVVWLVKKAFGL